MKIGNHIGLFMELDNTQPLQRAMVNTSQTLKEGSNIPREDGAYLRIRYVYERLSDFCYTCGRLENTESACAEILPANKENIFGPWMRTAFSDRWKSTTSRSRTEKEGELENVPFLRKHSTCATFEVYTAGTQSISQQTTT